MLDRENEYRLCAFAIDVPVRKPAACAQDQEVSNSVPHSAFREAESNTKSGSGNGRYHGRDKQDRCYNFHCRIVPSPKQMSRFRIFLRNFQKCVKSVAGV